MTEQEWLDSLKAGDEVCTQGYAKPPQLYTVARVTNTQIVIEHTNGVGGKYERKYRRAGGREIGGDRYYTTSLVKPTDNLRAEILIANLKGKARRLKDGLVVPDTVEALEKFIRTLRELGAK